MTAYDTDLSLYIGGEWLSSKGRDTQDVLNPATGGAHAGLPLASIDDLDRALEASERGFRVWRDTPPESRAAVLNKAAALLRERVDRIARIATLEQGKPQAEARGEILLASALLDFHAGEAQRIYGRVLPRPSGTRSLVLHQPVGPVAAFCSWNFPALNVVRKLGPAQSPRAARSSSSRARRPPAARSRSCAASRMPDCPATSHNACLVCPTPYRATFWRRRSRAS